MEARPGDILKFAWVACCFAVTFFRLTVACLRQDRSAAVCRDRVLLCLAMGFTTAADFCMVIQRKDITGLYCFLAVQLLYFVRLRRRGRELIWQAAAALCLCLGLGMAGVSLGWEGVLGVCYFTLFIGNLTVAFSCLRGRERLFAWGLFLFILCDIHVGLMNLGQFLTLPPVYERRVVPYCERILWLFYLPSQVLISVSSCNKMTETLPPRYCEREKNQHGI